MSLLPTRHPVPGEGPPSTDRLPPQEAHMGSGQEGAPSNHPVGSCYFHMPVNSSIWVYALRPTDFGSPKAETVFPHLD